jgi:hypothetical protein
MFRLFDWQCCECGAVEEQLIGVERGDFVPDLAIFFCAKCSTTTNQTRCVSLPAPYMGERPLNPMVTGGQFDTMGYEREPNSSVLRDGMTVGEFNEARHSKEYKETRREVDAVRERNKAKRERAAAIKRGENINMRTCRLPGDPKITS